MKESIISKDPKLVIAGSKEYRKNIVQQIKSLSVQGEVGKELAKELLESVRKTGEYKESKKSYQEIISGLEVLSRKRDTMISTETEDLLQTIFDYHTKTSEPYSEHVVSLIGKIVASYVDLLKGNRYGRLGDSLDMLTKFLDILPLSQQEEYSITALQATYFTLRRHVYVVKGGRVQQGIYPAQYHNFRCIKSYSETGHLSDTDDLYSCADTIEPLLEKILSRTQNPEYIKTIIILLIQYGYDLAEILPEGVMKSYMNEGNMKQIVETENIQKYKIYLGELLLALHKYGIHFSSESIDHCLMVMKELQSQKKVSFIREKTQFAPEGMPIKEVFRKITPKKLMDSSEGIYQDSIINKGRIKKEKEKYTSKAIREKIAKDCLNVEFINAHLDDLADILDNDGIAYVLRNINIAEDGQKLDQKILDSFEIRRFIWDDPSMSQYEGYERSIESDRRNIQMHKEMAKLVAKKVNVQTIPKCIPGYAFYDVLYDEGMLDEQHIDMFSPRDLIKYYSNRLESIHSNAGTPLDYHAEQRYRKIADTLLQDKVLPIIEKHIPGYIDHVLKSRDSEKIKGIIYNPRGLFQEKITQEQKDVFIKKTIESTLTQEDLAFLEEELLKNWNNSEIIFLKYRLYGECPDITTQFPIPASVYKEMLQKNMFQGATSMPQIINDADIQITNLEQIIDLFGQKNAGKEPR